MKIKMYFTVILMMLWCSLAGAHEITPASADKGFNLGHLDLHARYVSHHHDDGGLVHQDQSEQSSTHMVVDGVNAITAITVPTFSVFSTSPSSAIDHQPDSFLESLLVNLPFRPPRALT
jgi:hypothetical protein